MKSIDDSRSIFAKNLRRLLKQRGHDQVDLASFMRVSSSTASDWCNGKKYPRVDKVQKLADWLGVLKSDLTEEKGAFSDLPSNALPIPHMHKIPLIGDIACGTPIMAEQNIQNIVSCPDDIRADFCLRCHGDSMINARIFDGDIVYVHAQPEVENGEIAAVEILDGEESAATLKRFYRSGNTVTLMPENPQYAPLVYVGDEINNLKVDGKAVYFVSEIR